MQTNHPLRQSRYANIEREILAVVYGCEQFHTFLFSQYFTVESDHKPLESIHITHLSSSPPRLWRMLLRLQPYNVKIKYRPGSEVSIADALSRLSPEEQYEFPDMEVQIHDIHDNFSDEILSRLKLETSRDEELNVL